MHIHTTNQNNGTLTITQMEDSFHIRIGEMPEDVWMILTRLEFLAIAEQWSYEISAAYSQALASSPASPPTPEYLAAKEKLSNVRVIRG
jgi:hypothetical protein